MIKGKDIVTYLLNTWPHIAVLWIPQGAGCMQITYKYTMNKQLYDIPDAENLAVIQAWVAEPLNRSILITVGIEPNIRYQLAVYDQPFDEPSIPRTEAALGSMIQACAWSE